MLATAGAEESELELEKKDGDDGGGGGDSSDDDPMDEDEDDGERWAAGITMSGCFGLFG